MNKSSSPRCIWLGPAALGEGPLWHPLEKKLYWLDIAQPSLNCLDIQTGDNQSWLMPDYIGTVVPRATGGLIATVGNQVVAIDLPSGHLTPVVEVFPAERRDLRMNDGKCDALGRLWFGVASFDRDDPQGGLFCLDTNGQLIKKEEAITIANGLGWSPDQKTFYFTDGLRYRIYQYDFDLHSGSLSNRRLFLQLEPSAIEPDGLTVDRQGYIWTAFWASGKVFRYAPDGSLDRTLNLGVQRPTSCAFGGENYQTLFITSCSRNIGEKVVLPKPAGAIFAVDLAIGGFPENSFTG